MCFSLCSFLLQRCAMVLRQLGEGCETGLKQVWNQSKTFSLRTFLGSMVLATLVNSHCLLFLKMCLLLCSVLGPRRRGPKISHILSKFNWGTLCHDTSKCLKRLCVYSPEVTGSCLLTSVASTMEPRKVRKLKILTGFRPVSDQFQTLCPDASETLRPMQKERAKRETQREKERREKRIQKNRLSSMSKVNGYRKSKENKDIRKITQLNLLKVSEAEDPGAPGSQNF